MTKFEKDLKSATEALSHIGSGKLYPRPLIREGARAYEGPRDHEMRSKRTCCECSDTRSREDGFETRTAWGAEVWICWACYAKGTRSILAEKPGPSVRFNGRIFLLVSVIASALFAEFARAVWGSSESGWRVAIVLWAGASVGALLSLRPRRS
jgi:hypothetical protein